MRHQPVAGVVVVLGVTRAGGHAGGGGAASAAFEQVVVAGAVAVDIGAVVVGVADGVRLGGHARAVDGLQGARQAVVELAPGGRLLLRPGGRVAAAAGAGTVAVTLLLPPGRPEAGDDPLVPGAGPIGAEVQLPAEPVGPVVAVLGAARRLGLGAGVVLLAVAAAAGDVAVGVVGGVAEGPDGGALLAEASLGDLVEASPGGLGVDRLLARVGQPRGVVGAGEVVVGVIAVAGRLAALVGPLLERPVSVVRPGHPPGGVERAGGVAALGGALGLLAQGGVVEADLGVGRVLAAADPAGVEIGHRGAGAVLHAGGVGGGDRQAGPQQVAACVVGAVQVLPLGAIAAVKGQRDPGQPVVGVVGERGDVVGERGGAAGGVGGTRGDHLCAVAVGVVLDAAGHVPVGGGVQPLGDGDRRVALVIADRAARHPAGGDVLLGAGDVAVGVIAGAGLVPQRVAAGGAAVGGVVVEAGGEPHPGQRAGPRAGDRGEPCPGGGDRAQVPSGVVAQVGDALVGGAGAVLGLADHPVERVVVDQRGVVIIGGAGHALGLGDLERPPRVVVLGPGALAGRVGAGVGAGDKQRPVHLVVAGGGGDRAGLRVAGDLPVVRSHGAQRVVVGVEVGAGPQQGAAFGAGGLGRALAAQPAEGVVAEERAVGAFVGAGVVLVVGVLDPAHLPVGVVVDAGAVAQRIADDGGLPGGVVGLEHCRRVAVGVDDLRHRARVRRAGQVVVVVGDRTGRVGDQVGVARRVVAVAPLEVVGDAGGGHALRVGDRLEQRQVVTGVVGVHRGVGVGQLGGLGAGLVGGAGQVAVGVVGGGGEPAAGLGHLVDLEVGSPVHPDGLVVGVQDRGDLAGGVVGVGGGTRQRRGDPRDPADQVIGERRLVGQPVGALLEPPPQLGAVSGQVVGVGGLRAHRVAHAEDAGGLVGSPGLGVDPGRRGGDGRPGAVGGGVGEHQRPVSQDVAVGLGPAPLGQAQQVAVVVVVEVQPAAAVVDDRLDLASDVGLLGFGRGPVVDQERAASGVDDPGHALCRPARVLTGRGVLQDVGDAVAVAVLHHGGEPVHVEEEGHLVGAGQRPAASAVAGWQAAQVQVH